MTILLSVPRAMAAAFLTLAAGAAGAAPIATWDATADFSMKDSAGVNGVWSYGTTDTSLSGSFTKFKSGSYQHMSNYFHWHYGGTPAQYTHQLGKTTEAQYKTGSIIIPKHTLNLHPGAKGEFTMLRFTAPTDGRYQIDSAFWSNNTQINSDIHVTLNGVEQFNGLLKNTIGTATAFDWDALLNLRAGDTLDFAVGYGTDQAYLQDSIGLSAVVNQVPFVAEVPEPAPAGLMLSGLAMLAITTRRRNRA